MIRKTLFIWMSLLTVCQWEVAGTALSKGVVKNAPVAENKKNSKKKPFGGKLDIGVVIPRTGVVADYGEMSRRGVELALESLPSHERSDLEVFYQDSKNIPQEASNAIQKLINTNRVRVVVGDVGSQTSLAMALIAQDKKVPLVSPGATVDGFTDGKSYVSRICFDNSFQGYGMATYAFQKLNARKAAIFYDNSEYGKGLSESIKKRFSELGGKIVEEIAYNANELDFLSPLRKFRKLSLDILFLPGYYQQTGLIVRQAYELNLLNSQKQALKFVGSDGWASPVFFELAGAKASPGHYWVNHYAPDDKAPHVVEFVSAYKKKYKSDNPPVLAALYFDAIRMVVQAAKNARTNTPEDLNAAIVSSKDYVGVTGTITIGPDRNAKKSLTVLETTSNGYIFKDKILP